MLFQSLLLHASIPRARLAFLALLPRLYFSLPFLAANQISTSLAIGKFQTDETRRRVDLLTWLVRSALKHCHDTESTGRQ